ncbi:TolC family protein [Sphingobacterium sp. SRCM116780]|uniref:TolC family protein n=1 Tax=Sphingobacterium sp. SRCM116780 TaxID=2907623 RepID=UPI001F1FB93B|nr:TolC family protein [Sphingobacterium sp. SRCM116780]UIR55621.1 TolC family protein [Sphingobacterium sp. SRCM116780]
MDNIRIQKCIGIVIICLTAASCKVPAIPIAKENKALPTTYSKDSVALANDTTNMVVTPWRDFFSDHYLSNLIDTALKNNQELMITLQEIEIAKSEVRFKQGQLFPTVEAGIGAGVEKVGRYTSQGAGDASTEITPGKNMPDPLMNYEAAITGNWEVDIWGKLHDQKKAAISRYLSTVEGKNFVLTNLVAEVANSYYELLALDNQLEVIQQTIQLQKEALEVIQIQKEAARSTELAVQKFKAEVLNSQSLAYEIKQDIKETENKINLLLGRYAQEIPRDKNSFLTTVSPAVRSGVPSQLLANRPDIKKAELELAAAKLDVKIARKEFYPSFNISATLGLEAFKPSYFVKMPESMLYSLAGELAGPLINKSGIKAEFSKANAVQLQAMYNYQQTILSAYANVSNHLSKINNLQKSYDLKSQQVDALTKSNEISNDLFKSARVDYFEVLMTQRDALEAKLELITTKRDQLNTVTNMYRDLGGGWK